ncbi:MAG: zf-HC2 domain-containing protein [candidate division WOR-3 bacterium]
MIDCYNIKYYLFEYIDGELNQELRVAITEHLSLCPHCSELHQAYSRLISFCQHCCNLEVPKEIHDELWNFLGKFIEPPSNPKFHHRVTKPRHRSKDR